MIWTIIGIIILMWLLGFNFEIGGNFIHLLIVIALVIAIINLITGRRA